METLQTIWKLSRRSGNFPDNLVTFQKNWKLSRPSIHKISRQNQNFPDNSETFKTIWKLSRGYRNFLETSVIFQKVPDIIDKSMFSTKTSGCAKTFRGAMLPRSLRISVSALKTTSTEPKNYLNMFCHTPPPQILSKKRPKKNFPTPFRLDPQTPYWKMSKRKQGFFLGILPLEHTFGFQNQSVGFSCPTTVSPGYSLGKV